jgi:hypothetical protein
MTEESVKGSVAEADHSVRSLGWPLFG